MLSHLALPYASSLTTPTEPLHDGLAVIFLSCTATLVVTLLAFRCMRSCNGFPRAFTFQTAILVQSKVTSVASTTARSSSSPETSAPFGVPPSDSLSIMLNIDSPGNFDCFRPKPPLTNFCETFWICHLRDVHSLRSCSDTPCPSCKRWLVSGPSRPFPVVPAPKIPP